MEDLINVQRVGKASSLTALLHQSSHWNKRNVELGRKQRRVEVLIQLLTYSGPSLIRLGRVGSSKLHWLYYSGSYRALSYPPIFSDYVRRLNISQKPTKNSLQQTEVSRSWFLPRPVRILLNMERKPVCSIVEEHWSLCKFLKLEMKWKQ